MNRVNVQSAILKIKGHVRMLCGMSRQYDNNYKQHWKDTWFEQLLYLRIYIIKERLETLCAMESYLPNSDRHAASWIFSDGPSKPLGVAKLRYNALKLFFYNVANANVPLSARFSFPSFVYVARNVFYLKCSIVLRVRIKDDDNNHPF